MDIGNAGFPASDLARLAFRFASASAFCFFSASRPTHQVLALRCPVRDPMVDDTPRSAATACCRTDAPDRP